MPLYPGSDITISMAVVLIMSFVVRHKLTKRTIDDLLKLLNIFFGGALSLTRSVIDKYVEDVKYALEKHYFYSKCLCAVEEDCTLCPITGCHNDLEQEGARCYFITLPLIQQLSNLLQNQSSYDNIFCPKQSDHNNMSDLTDGELYQNFKRKTGQQKAVSFSWNTDGVSIFRSSNYNIWHFYLTVNEMSEHNLLKIKICF